MIYTLCVYFVTSYQLEREVKKLTEEAEQKREKVEHLTNELKEATRLKEQVYIELI